MPSASRFVLAAALLAILAATVTLFAEPVISAGLVSPIRWKGNSIKIAISSSLTASNPNIKTGTNVRDVIGRSLAAWEAVSSIRFVEISTDKSSVSPPGVSGDGISLITIAQTPENLGLFQNDWQTTSARTRVFYNRKNEITEADIVLNPYAQFSDDGTFGTFDLESTLTHEIGHLLGLSHSFSVGSAMYSNAGRNGLFGLQSRNARTLSPEDVSALQGIYGSGDDDFCCGQISGRLTLAGGKMAPNLQVWAEDAASGAVANCTITDRLGKYRLDGMREGRFYVYAQDRSPGPTAVKVGEVEIEKGKTATLGAAIAFRNSDIDVRFLGINSQIADAAVPVNAGRTYVFYLGGSNLNAEKMSVGVNSPFFTSDTESVANVDFSDTVSVIRAEIKIDAETPPGNYSIFVKTGSGLRYIVGGIAVETFADPWDFSSVSAR